MTPQHILAMAVLIVVVMLGAIGVIDALEPGRLLDGSLTAEIAWASVVIAGVSVGIVLFGRRRK